MIGIALIYAVFGLMPTPDAHSLPPGGRRDLVLEGLEAGATYWATVTLEGIVAPRDRTRVVLDGPGGFKRSKVLNPGDADVFWSFRPSAGGDGSIAVIAEPETTSTLSVRMEWGRRDVPEADRTAIEAEPNDSWREANPLALGRPVHGTADDVDDLDNPDEGRSGLDWFRFEVPPGPTALAFFHLELLDRDVSANLRIHRLDATGTGIASYEEGKDPTEVVHDRERERYSTHLSRTLAPGTYFVEVNANHPDYILRTRVAPVPPYADPKLAVDVGLQYLLEAGDAWFAQIPREGNRFTRSANLHDTAVRCSACHASTYPVEAALVGQANGYPIRAKQSLLYLTDRLANAPTPLYGGEGLFWQRFIAIPLQAQGKQGGVLLDFARQVDGRDAALVDRFGPFLRAAWRGRGELPPDEMNGVVPLDSKFGSAWRDWRVLTEMVARHRRVADAQAADAIADILADPATDARVENLQDRMQRLHAWSTIDPAQFAGRIAAEAEALLRLQNTDGGWHELGTHGRPSAVYPTGQMAWTLMAAGVPSDDPRVARALAFLLARQKPFGGWFETTTHENFRTPMRETRYALEALAVGFPRNSQPLKSWGNRSSEAAILPQPGNTPAILNRLDDTWDVHAADRPRFAAAIASLLDSPDAVVRARAASALGRLGDSSSVEPLAQLLGDPSKIASRSAAWALRKLGNRGLGVEAIRRALDSPDPATRRGGVRVFAQQFPGMDARVDLADALIGRMGDPDLRTRLEAARSLRQWFYRTADVGLQRRIVAAYLDRMAVPDEPVVRRALAEGMYILLDENLGGGVSLGRTLAALPERSRARALAGREAVERDALLGPVLAAMAAGNSLQREALVRSFDGSFFRGRSYARRPTGMIDVGNDREFGFLHEPAADLVDRALAATLGATDLPALARAGAIRLAGFFRALDRPGDPAVRLAAVQGLLDPDEAVRLATRDAVGRDLSLTGAGSDPALLDLLVRAIGADDGARRAVATALGRSPDVADGPAIVAAIRRQLGDPTATLALIPALRGPTYADAEVAEAAARAWPVAADPADRARILGALLDRPTLFSESGTADPLVALFGAAGRDPAASVRERALEAFDSARRFRSSQAGRAALLAALADDEPAVRRRALDIAGDLGGFWDDPGPRDRLRARLADPDPGTRGRALAVAARHRLAQDDPAIARRVKALSIDPALGPQALAALADQGLDPASIPADAARPRRLPSLATFRDRVEPLLRRPGEDGVSCVGCHANQAAFRVVGADAGGDALAINYQSALRALDPADPEASLLLRKPRSPRGAGDGDPASPTGLTHNGGPRWEGADHFALRAIRAWIAEADAGRPAPAPAIVTADGYSPAHPPGLASDGDLDTFWQTETEGALPGYPHELTLDLGATGPLRGLLVIPRRDRPDGRVRTWEVDLSTDGAAWDRRVARGTWDDGPTFRYVPLGGLRARFVRLRGLDEVGNGPTMSLAEVMVDLASPAVGWP